MNNLTRRIIRNSTANKTLNILTFPTHERYETGLCLTGHNFYSFRAPKNVQEIKRDWNVLHAPIPKNYMLINEIPAYIDFDLILSQNKFGQYQLSKEFKQLLHVPLVCLEHTLPIPNWEPGWEKTINAMRGNINIFISNYSVEEWKWISYGDTHVIHHMVDTNLFNSKNVKRENHLLSVVNDWVNRSYACNFFGWQRITKGLPVKVVGDTEGVSKPAKNTKELIEIYQTSKIFLNTSTVSPIPTSLLEAMSCECACVSTETCMIPEIIEHGVNGFISNSEKELRNYCEILLKDNNLAKKFGKKARETILNKFNKDRFITEWNTVFNSVLGL